MAAFILVLLEEEDLDTAADRRAAKLLLPEELLLLLLVLPLPVAEEVSPRFLPLIVCMIISLYLCTLALVDARCNATKCCATHVFHRPPKIYFIAHQDSGHGGMNTSSYLICFHT